VEQWAEIRRLFFVRKLSQREIDRRPGLHRDTIRRALASAEPPVYRRRGLSLRAEHPLGLAQLPDDLVGGMALCLHRL